MTSGGGGGVQGGGGAPMNGPAHAAVRSARAHCCKKHAPARLVAATVQPLPRDTHLTLTYLTVLTMVMAGVPAPHGTILIRNTTITQCVPPAAVVLLTTD